MNERLHVDIGSLQSLHRFGDLFERALRNVVSDVVTLEPLREAVDSIGRHWYGMRLRVRSKASGQQFYLHTGLIYLPETRIGLMVEVDRKNNLNAYSILWDGLSGSEALEVNRDEPEYLKLFMPDEAFAALSELNAHEQVERLTAFAKAACEAIACTEDRRGFCIAHSNLLDAYHLAQSFESALEASSSPLYQVNINRADPDNFGQYASGYRYWLKSPDGSISMYAYFGAIYSYKKRPCGIFAEIDAQSNREVYDKVYANMTDDAAYEFSRQEPAFIKLFMPSETTERFNAADAQEQTKILMAFLNACNAHLMEAAQKREE